MLQVKGQGENFSGQHFDRGRRSIYLFIITGQAALLMCPGKKGIYKDLQVLASYNDLRIYSNVSKLLVNKFKSP